MDNSYSSIVVNKQFYEYNNNSFSQTKSIKIKISNTYSQKKLYQSRKNEYTVLQTCKSQDHLKLQC